MTEEIVKHQETAVAIPSAQNLRMLAQDLLNSGLFPNVKNVAGAITIIQYGRELGIPPVASLQTMAIVNGRLCLEAKAILAIFQNHGGHIKILERSKTVARIEFSKEGQEPYTHEYSMEQAKTEKLAGKDNWLKMPETMLFWRAVATGIRLFDPGAIFGLYSREEMADLSPNGQKVATTLAPPPPVVAPEPSQPQKQAFGEPSADFFEQAESVKDAEIVEPGGSDDGFFGADEPKPYTVKGPQPIQEPALFSDDVLSGLIDAIKEGLRVEGIDAKEYKAWLYHYQTEMKPARMFVGMKFGHPSFSSGDGGDLKWLHTKLWDSVKKYKAWKRGQTK